MVHRTGLIIVVLMMVVAFSCKEESKKIVVDENQNLKISLKDSLTEEEMVLFIVPSPFQVSSLLKVLELDYSADLVSRKKLLSENAVTSQQKALNLGICMVDMGYANIYGEYQPALEYLTCSKKLMEDLGLDTPKEIAYLERVKKNMQLDDSLKQIFIDYKSDFDPNFIMKRDKKTGLLVMCGFYIESLYHLVKIYENNLDNEKLSSYVNSSMNTMILQQQVLLKNLIELLNEFSDPEIRKVISQLNLVQLKFDELRLDYSIDKDSSRITHVQLNTEKIVALEAIVGRVREAIVN